MPKDRGERAGQVLRDVAAEFLAREAGPQSLITITRAEVASNFSQARLFITVLPEEKEEAALGLINRTMPELKSYLAKRIRFPRMPHIEAVLDREEKNRQQLDSLS